MTAIDNLGPASDNGTKATPKSAKPRKASAPKASKVNPSRFVGGKFFPSVGHQSVVKAGETVAVTTNGGKDKDAEIVVTLAIPGTDLVLGFTQRDLDIAAERYAA